MRGLTPYKTKLFVRKSSLFKDFSDDLSGPFTVSKKSNRFLLFSFEHLIGWPVAAPTVRNTAEVVKKIMETMIIPPFEAPEVVISDNAACVTVPTLVELIKKHGAQW